MNSYFNCSWPFRKRYPMMFDTLQPTILSMLRPEDVVR